MGTNESALANPSGHTSLEVEGVIWNATQHTATADQIEQGVVDLPPKLRAQLAEFLTFEKLPTNDDLLLRGVLVTEVLLRAGAKPGSRVLIGGAPFFMESLCTALRSVGYVPVFAFSRRESVEKVMSDGSVQKVAVFRHLGFVTPEAPWL